MYIQSKKYLRFNTNDKDKIFTPNPKITASPKRHQSDQHAVDDLVESLNGKFSIT